jgi:hypothetical protein
MDEAKWEEAAERFEFAARAKNTPGLRYYIGYCQEKAGLLVEARDSYVEAKTLLETQPAADVETLIPEALERVETALPRVSLRGAPQGAKIFVDGKDANDADELMLNPGEHSLKATAPDHEDFETTVALREGQTEIILVKMTPREQRAEPAPVSAPPPAVEPEESRGPAGDGARRAVFWTGVGVGVAGLATGVVGTIVFASADGDLKETGGTIDGLSSGGDSACYQAQGDLAEACGALTDSGRKRSTGGNLMIGGYAAAGVGVATALVAHFLWPNVSDGRVQVHAAAAPGAGSVSLNGSF